MISPARYIPISPVLLVQGLWTRARTLRLPEPAGPRSGKTGTGPPLRVLIAGDSSAAGVGAEHQEEALSGRLAHQLAKEFSVSWRLEAETGHTTAQTLERLSCLSPEPFDVAVTSLGVNDVTGHTALREWLEQQRELRSLLTNRFGVSLIVVSSLPPMHKFPALPRPLRDYLGERAKLFDRALRTDLEASGEGLYLDLRFSDDPALIASDGFHPGPAMYVEWARRAAGQIENNFEKNGLN